MSDATPTRIVDSLQFTISIHAPHERCDFVAVYVLSPLGLFQSTHRMSDATTPHRRLAAHLHISIHAPHERCDQRFQRFRRYHRDFNPRTAWAMRPAGLRWSSVRSVISIHAPHERCDVNSLYPSRMLLISIHAPHERCDEWRQQDSYKGNYFNPRTAWAMRHFVQN